MRSIPLPFIAIVLTVLSGACGDRAAGERARAEAASRAAEQAAREKQREAALERDRLADLWSYHEVPVGKGRQLSASIFSAEGVDTDGAGPQRVQLVFRDHPSWGRSSYLVLQSGDFDCYNGCTSAVAADDGARQPMASRRPKTDEAIAMFINDERTLWRLTSGADRLTIEFPVRAGGTRTARFEVAGLDPAKMPGWQ